VTNVSTWGGMLASNYERETFTQMGVVIPYTYDPQFHGILIILQQID